MRKNLLLAAALVGLALSIGLLEAGWWPAVVALWTGALALRVIHGRGGW